MHKLIFFSCLILTVSLFVVREGKADWLDSMNRGNPIDTSETQDVINCNIDFDSNGNAFCAYSQSDGSHERIYVSRYNGTEWEKWTANGWGSGTAIPIDTGLSVNAYNAYNPKIAFDSNNNAFCVFRQENEIVGGLNIYATYYDFILSTWTVMNSGNPLSSTSFGFNLCYAPAINIDSNGNAICVWSQRNTPSFLSRIYAAKWNGTTWEKWTTTGWAASGTLVPLDTGRLDNAICPTIAFDSNNNAICSFAQNLSEIPRIYASKYDVSLAAWAVMNAGNPIDTGEIQYAIDPDIVFDSNNNALCVYRQSDGNTDRIYASRYTGIIWEKWTANGWGTGTAIPIDTGMAQAANYPGISINSYDNAICTFTHSGRLYANRYNASDLTWILMNGGNPLDTQTGAVSVCDIAFNHEKNAITVYIQDNGTNKRLYARWYQGGPKITSISPSSGPNNGTVNITDLAGSNFVIDSVVKLNKSGEADIIATDVNIISKNKITCNFDLTGKVEGNWDVVVGTGTETTDGILVNAFTITPPVVSPTTILGISPNSGTKGEITSCTITGTNFASATVKLTKSGERDIIG